MVVIRLRCSLPAYHSKPSLICDFCPSDQRFAYSFLQILPRDRHPCCSAIHFPLSGHVRDLHPLERAHGAQTQKEGNKSCLLLFSDTIYTFLAFFQFPTSSLLQIHPALILSPKLPDLTKTFLFQNQILPLQLWTCQLACLSLLQ